MKCYQFLFILLSLTVSLMSCATPTLYTDKPLQAYDQDTKYNVDEKDNGFVVNVYYSRYQFLPESNVIAAACKSIITNIAYEIAEVKGKKIKDINDNKIKISMGRNEITGITSCSISVRVEYTNIEVTNIKSEADEVIEVLIEGYDDGIKATKQQDRDEALMDAKLQAIERAGVSISAITIIENFMIKKDLIESKSNGILLPGFQIIDKGYQNDGTYLVILSGQIKTTLSNENRK